MTTRDWARQRDSKFVKRRAIRVQLAQNLAVIQFLAQLSVDYQYQNQRQPKPLHAPVKRNANNTEP
jgi:hypothetical protein